MSFLFDDPHQVKIHISDERQWLVTHKGDSYDLVILNYEMVPFEGVTYLGSQEFLALVKPLMSPEGVGISFVKGKDPYLSKTFAFVYPFVSARPSLLFFGKGGPLSFASQKEEMGSPSRSTEVLPNEREEFLSYTCPVVTDDNMAFEYK
jgi:hypothetical protein